MVTHCEHLVALLTHRNDPCFHPAADCMTAQPKADQTTSNFPHKTGSNWLTLSWPINCMSTWQLRNHQWDIAFCAQMIEEGCGKRTLPICRWRDIGGVQVAVQARDKWCAPAAILRRNYFENYSEEELTSWEAFASLGWERWSQMPGEA